MKSKTLIQKILMIAITIIPTFKCRVEKFIKEFDVCYFSSNQTFNGIFDYRNKSITIETMVLDPENGQVTEIFLLIKDSATNEELFEKISTSKFTYDRSTHIASVVIYLSKNSIMFLQKSENLVFNIIAHNIVYYLNMLYLISITDPKSIFFEKIKNILQLLRPLKSSILYEIKILKINFLNKYIHNVEILNEFKKLTHNSKAGIEKISTDIKLSY